MSIERIKNAMERGELEKVKTLLIELPKSHIDQRDETGGTLLCKAMSLGREDMVKALMEAGASLSAVSIVRELHQDPVEFPPLHICVLLIGRSILRPDKSQTAYASKRILQCLVDHGANVELRDSQGFTATERAVRWSVPQIAEDLKAMVLARREKEIITQAVLKVDPQGLGKSSKPRRQL